MSLEKKYSIGCDVDKHAFKVCFLFIDSISQKVKSTKTFANQAKGFAEFESWIVKHNKENTPLSITLEATGVYHENLTWYLHSKGYRIHVVLPTKAKHYVKSLGVRSKTDKIDAHGLARMGGEQSLQEWKPCSKELYSLRKLTRQVEALQHSRTIFLNQLEAATHSHFQEKIIIKHLKSLIRKIEKDIQKLKLTIEERVKSDVVLWKKYQYVASMKGLGLFTFATIISETGGFELFQNQAQLVCYAGYDVVENQSGKRVGKTHISKKGNTHIRRILHMAAFNMVTHQVKVFKDLYERVYERTNLKMKAYVAVQRKLLIMIYALWKKDTAFDPGYNKINIQRQEL
jgi:transposase